jgi:periplasmic copper chaperone A
MLRAAVTALCVALSIALPGAAFAQGDAVTVKEAWARATVPGQKGTGAFMTLTARDGARVTGAASPVAGVVEIHEMKMEGDVMRMRPVSVLELPAGRPIELKPGGFHVMLLDLKQALKVGDKVPLELRLETSDGKKVTLPVQVDVRSQAPGRDSHGGKGHKH